MEERCKTCRFWVPFAGFDRHKSPDGWGSCLMAENHNGEPLNAETLAYAGDVDEWEAHLVTAPDFGCVQWQAKEAS